MPHRITHSPKSNANLMNTREGTNKKETIEFEKKEKHEYAKVEKSETTTKNAYENID